MQGNIQGNPQPIRRVDIGNNYICVVLFLFISIGLQLGGLIAPGWLVLENNSASSHLGLFLTTACTSEKCETKSNDDVFDVDVEITIDGVTFGKLKEYRAETITAVVACFIALVILIRVQCTRDLSKRSKIIHLVVALLALVLTASLALAASGKWGNRMMSLEDLKDYLKPPYALILTGVGGVISGITLLYLIVHTYRLNSQPDTVPQVTGPSTGQPYVVYTSQPQMNFNSLVYSNVTPSAPPLDQPPPSYNNLYNYSTAYGPSQQIHQQSQS